MLKLAGIAGSARQCTRADRATCKDVHVGTGQQVATDRVLRGDGDGMAGLHVAAERCQGADVGVGASGNRTADFTGGEERSGLTGGDGSADRPC